MSDRKELYALRATVIADCIQAQAAEYAKHAVVGFREGFVGSMRLVGREPTEAQIEQATAAYGRVMASVHTTGAVEGIRCLIGNLERVPWEDETSSFKLDDLLQEAVTQVGLHFSDRMLEIENMVASWYRQAHPTAPRGAIERLREAFHERYP